jgi:hypothetical protein
MRNALIFFLFLLALPHALFAQKEDNIWLLGGSLASDSVYKTCMFDFSEDTLAITYIYQNLPFSFTNASISDAAGNLICFSNGENIYNRNREVMENGLDFYPGNNPNGYPASQSYILLPIPKDASKIIQIYGKPDFLNDGTTIGYTQFYYAVADMDINNGLGDITIRDLSVGNDTPAVGQITAVRHGNGQDWWVLVPRFEGNVFYRYLLKPNGFVSIGAQTSPATPMGLGQTVFSPDGQWYARYNWHGIVPNGSFSTFDLYRFDRCTGLLGEHIAKTYNTDGQLGRAGGIAFSNSSRYLYVSKWDTIFQYDLQAPNVLASEVVVAVYDGFLAEFNRPTRFFRLLLAPDNKIYVSIPNNNSRYLHVIEKPDLPGPACEVRQHAIHLPVFNNNLLPNMPYYRLREWVGSPCDTLGSVAVGESPAEIMFRAYPNPAADAVQLTFDPPVRPDTRVLLTDMTGRIWADAPVANGATNMVLPVRMIQNGTYLIKVQSRDQVAAQQKLIIIH